MTKPGRPSTRDPRFPSKRVRPLKVAQRSQSLVRAGAVDGELLRTGEPSGLASEIGQMIEGARQHVAQAANAALTTLYWQIGTRIRQDVLKERRAEYGAEIVSAVGRQLEARFGRGFDEKSLRHMLRFAEAFPDGEIVSALRRQLSWTHFKQIIYVDDPLRRDFYAEMCRIEGWSTRVLQQKIDGMLYERTALSKKPAALIRHELAALRDADQVTPDLVFQDPYLMQRRGICGARPACMRVQRTILEA